MDHTEANMSSTDTESSTSTSRHTTITKMDVGGTAYRLVVTDAPIRSAADGTACEAFIDHHQGLILIDPGLAGRRLAGRRLAGRRLAGRRLALVVAQAMARAWREAVALREIEQARREDRPPHEALPPA